MKKGLQQTLRDIRLLKRSTDSSYPLTPSERKRQLILLRKYWEGCLETADYQIRSLQITSALLFCNKCGQVREL